VQLLLLLLACRDKRNLLVGESTVKATVNLIRCMASSCVLLLLLLLQGQAQPAGG
jgi:hypothetical protein